ncbi:HAD-IA family hydrolase [Pseudoalteromonas sp. OOF1S-7]|uniref:HAD family hydrolase n=1 Tax=Pseudoalteromonas sp. OOF1S-7 TaxID=2917757 RepID=UPI001EF65FC6|nr:HAD-IA family hydrolase [Pseudoalteromonas sp. OOF1S-7]MCG7537126.1 HAD-IA family hydrolase [Pseudoalteromonas sp. OOF1S-7]
MKAVIFDMDGVISDSASIHAVAWEHVLSDVVKKYISPEQKFTYEDYLNYVDGRSRLEGIQCFLTHKKILLPQGQLTDTSIDSIHGISNLKNSLFNDIVDRDGVKVFSDALSVIDKLTIKKVPIGIGTSSKNAVKILNSIGIFEKFEFLLDGNIAAENNVASKPNGEFYAYACKLANTPRQHCVVIEDAISGVIAAKNANVGMVIAVDRGNNEAQLFEAGADVVVQQLTDIDLSAIG